MRIQNIKYPVWENGKIELIEVSELSENYKNNQIRYHKNRIKESEYLLSLLQ